MDNYYYKNLYEILGIEPTDDLSKIKSAYRSLARKYHPDLNGGNELFAKKFKEISQSYEILTDKAKKSNYDIFKGYTFTKTEKKQQKEPTQKTAQTKKSDTKASNTNTKFSDTLGDIIDGLFKSADSIKSSKQKKSANKKPPQNGSDITTEVTISYEEALTGTNRTVNILHTEICPNCHGKTFLNGAKCPLCKGEGETSIHKKINVKIPKNIKQNTKIRIAGEGNRGRYGGKNGNVYLVVKIQNNEKYTFDGLNVELEQTIYPHIALLGGEINVNTPQGNITMKIPPNTRQGQKFRLSEHGLKDETGKIGDAIVTVRIDLPEEMSEEERELYEKLSKLNKSKDNRI